MGIENFISTALVLPNDYISYYISRELAELYPEKAIIEGETCLFDLEAYARGKKCEIVKESSVFNELKADWRGPGKKLRHEAGNAWFNVFWQGHFLEVLFVTWMDEGCKSRYHWIIADSPEIAENFFRAVCDWCAEVRGEILVFDDGQWTKSKELFRAIKTTSFDNLILPAALRDEIQSDFERFFASRQAYERYGIPWKRGVLFIGPPGNGKTHTVKALINHLKQPCLYVKSFKSRYGTEQEAMQAVFQRARHTTPCLVVLEDIDSLVDRKSRSFFLNELDGFATNTGVVVLATTNHPERLDPAILDRPSRFDRKYYFELPAPAERRAYACIWSGKLQDEMRVSEGFVNGLVEKTEGFSFAYMKELFLSSMMQWMSAPEPKSIEAIMADRMARLREQMSSAIVEADGKSDGDSADEDD